MKRLVDEELLRLVLDTHIKVLDAIANWNKSDDLLGIQYSDTSMRAAVISLRAALEQPAVEPNRYAWMQYVDHGNGVGGKGGWV